MYETFTESGLQFSFSAQHWQVKKYDDHPYFTGFSSVGMKGVDFIAIREEEELWLIEVKNYQTNGASIREPKVKASLEHPEKILEAVEQKFEDTLAGIQAIHTYYKKKKQKRWKWLVPWQKPDQEELFWLEVCELAANPKKVKLILWLELEEENRAIKSYLLDNLGTGEESLKDYKIFIFSRKFYQHQDVLKVESA